MLVCRRYALSDRFYRVNYSGWGLPLSCVRAWVCGVIEQHTTAHIWPCDVIRSRLTCISPRKKGSMSFATTKTNKETRQRRQTLSTASLYPSNALRYLLRFPISNGLALAGLNCPPTHTLPVPRISLPSSSWPLSLLAPPPSLLSPRRA